MNKDSGRWRLNRILVIGNGKSAGKAHMNVCAPVPGIISTIGTSTAKTVRGIKNAVRSWPNCIFF
ncbi:hypothetical protein D0469_02645 [Peribacillus saganii]|uniref:Uncharacterized protein n=1 Tax=Peribacillus saganii TaxID=2303992 RepID=A0A372LSR9_9BACI|nr:hypothetical protein D0469_02645 [Peribacillus saganii]